MRLWRSRSEPPGSDHPGTLVTNAEPYLRVESFADVEELASLILAPEREHLVVVLTSRSGQKGPSVDADDVRAIVGGEAAIYCLPTGPYSRDLADRVPRQKSPYNGSLRVWLPHVSAEDDQPHEYSSVSVFDATGEYGPASITALAYQLRDAFLARAIEPQVEPVQAYRSLQINRVRAEAEVAKRDSEEQVEQARRERDEALERERQAGRRLRMAERDSGASVSAEDPEGALRLLILQRWLDLSYEERRQHPLGRYVLGPDFVRSTESLTYLVRDRLAFVCAMVVCDRVDQLASLALHPLSSIEEEVQGISKWQCSLTRIDSQSPPAVRYQRHSADGTITFTGTGAYGDPVDPRR